MRITTLLLALSLAAAAQEPPPTLPHVEKDGCPFEGCVYRAWTALRDIPVFDTWTAERKPTGTLHPGDKVKALGGVVITTRPGSIHVDRDVPEAGLRRGDLILTYTNRGEGFSAAWTNGKFHKDFDISIAKLPDGSGCGGAHCAATYVDLGEKEWWAEIQLASGVKVWVKMANAGEFDGINQLDGR